LSFRETHEAILKLLPVSLGNSLEAIPDFRDSRNANPLELRGKQAEQIPEINPKRIEYSAGRVSDRTSGQLAETDVRTREGRWLFGFSIYSIAASAPVFFAPSICSNNYLK
jgi:hypothetical protein